MSINNPNGGPIGGTPTGIEAALGDAARSYLKARLWTWIGAGTTLLAGAIWLAMTITVLSGRLAPETVQLSEKVCYGILLPAAVGTCGAAGSRQTAETWLRSLQHRLAPGSYSSSALADARKFAHPESGRINPGH
ncbi:hypothetical protein AB0I53_11065 [Saccharopolyspora sp. NPDC050389]|uniref:hypothetical protein n=1 Tax=Saccharopolyspora sp. NPDC050389 TaxID=3155516 RepID=UPI0033F5647A